MARNEKKRQKKLQKQKAKRKQKQAQISKRMAQMGAPSLNRARDWPLEAAWITANWREREQLIQMLFTRRGPHGHIALGNVLVDTMCLGVKNAYGRITDEYEYKSTLETMRNNQEMVPADIDLIAKIIRDSVAYARELGLRPNKDLPQALKVLGDANPEACPLEIPLGGPDGRPYFFAGPNDNVDRIMKILTDKLGPDGFTYTVELGGAPDLDMFLDEEIDGIEEHDDGTIVLADTEYQRKD